MVAKVWAVDTKGQSEKDRSLGHFFWTTWYMKFYVMFIDQKKFLFSIHTSAINDSGALERSIHDKEKSQNQSW